MNMYRMARSAERLCRKNKGLLLTLAGGMAAGIVAVMISKLG